MFKTRLIVPSLLMVVIAAGCNAGNRKSPQASANPSAATGVLDIPATPAPPPAPAASYTPSAPPQPIVYDTPPAAAAQPVIEESLADASEPAAAAPRVSRTAGGTKYKIRKGESLWSIAQARYGNGNKWKTIAAANPSIDPNRVQAGQTIVLP